jgi:MATE family multidrug resistance protein
MMATQLVYCGRVSREALTSATIAVTMWNMLWMAITGVGGTMDTLGSQAYGAGDDSAVKSWAMLTTGILCASVVPATGILATSKELAISVFHADRARAPEIRDCAMIMALSFYPLALTLGAQKYLSVKRKVGAIGCTSVATLFMNVGFHHAFMTVGGYGIRGSCWAMVCARVANLVLIIAYIAMDEGWCKRRGHGAKALRAYGDAYRTITSDMTKRAWWLSMSGMIMVFGEAFSFELTVVLAAMLGDVALSAHMVMLNICTFTFMCGPMAFGTAASIRVGNLLGAGHPERARRSAWLIVCISVSFMACCAVTILLCVKPIASIYTAGDEEISAALVKIAPFAALFQIFDGLLGSCNGVLRACGKQALIATSNLFSLWICGLVSGFLFVLVGGFGVRGVWWGLAIGVTCAGSFLAGLASRIDWSREAARAKLSATSFIARTTQDDNGVDATPV